MLSAFKSDFYLMKSTIRFYLIAQVLMIFLAVTNNSPSLYLFYPTFMSLAITMSISTNTQSFAFSGILLSSPISRKNIVMGRYLFVLSICIPVLIISCAIMFMANDATGYETIKLIIIWCAIILTLQAIFTPLTYVLKPNYIGIAFFSICFIPSVLVILLKPLLKRSNINIEQLTSTIENIYNSLSALSIILLASLILLAISIIISISVFKKKEF